MSAFDDGLWIRLVEEHDADCVGFGPDGGASERSRRPLVFGLSGLGTLGAAGATVAVLSLSGGASNAFAGWTAHPGKATAAELSAASDYCDAHMGFPGLPLALSEERGPFTAEIFANGTQNDFCLVGPSFSNSSGFQTSSPVQAPAGRLFLWGDHTFSDGGQPYGAVIARAADDVTAVTFALDDGTEVTATLQNGWVVAWWPGSQQVSSAQLTTPSGTQTQTFSRCAVENCAGGGPHGGAPGGGPGGG
ncbi:MAG TPA: hypothetical protein VMF07_21575 [Solirubrobacteraceae bacterium]|nr:hypothetical protein [Solirubrobacteraceae bacterium]